MAGAQDRCGGSVWKVGKKSNNLGVEEVRLEFLNRVVYSNRIVQLNRIILD